MCFKILYFNINELFKQRQHLFIKKQVEILQLGQLSTSKGFCSNGDVHAAAKLVHHQAIAVFCVFFAPPLQGSPSSFQALPRQRGKCIPVPRSLWIVQAAPKAEMVKICTNLQWKYWVIFVSSLLERLVASSLPLSVGSGIKRSS